jgi:AraC-like DNA-binding protein
MSIIDVSNIKFTTEDVLQQRKFCSRGNSATEEDLQLHLNCPDFYNDSDSIFDIFSHREGVEIIQKTKSVALIIVIEGKIQFSFDNKNIRKASKNDCFMLPVHADFNVKFLSSASLLYFYIPNEPDLCWIIKKNLAGYTLKTTENGNILKINNFIQNHINLFLAAVKNGVVCKQFLNNQLQCLLSCLCVFYPLELLTDFFAPMRSYTLMRGQNFKASVLENRNKFFKVSEFAAAAYMAQVTFRRHFEQVFDMSPKEWIIQERKKLIETELKYGTKSLNEISVLTGFKSVREFFAFCKKQLGQTALSIRKSVIF